MQIADNSCGDRGEGGREADGAWAIQKAVGEGFLKRQGLLEPVVAALERLEWGSSSELRLLFAEVSQRRPDLLQRSLFAERSGRTLEVEKLLKETIAEIEFMVRARTLPNGVSEPILHNMRFNHSTGKLHIGHGNRSTLIFPDPDAARELLGER